MNTTTLKALFKSRGHTLTSLGQSVFGEERTREYAIDGGRNGNVALTKTLCVVIPNRHFLTHPIFEDGFRLYPFGPTRMLLSEAPGEMLSNGFYLAGENVYGTVHKHAEEDKQYLFPCLNPDNHNPLDVATYTINIVTEEVRWITPDGRRTSYYGEGIDKAAAAFREGDILKGCFSLFHDEEMEFDAYSAKFLQAQF